jgi:hypothetical protein
MDKHLPRLFADLFGHGRGLSPVMAPRTQVEVVKVGFELAAEDGPARIRTWVPRIMSPLL